MGDDDTVDDDDENENGNDENGFHVQLATSSTETTRKTLSDQVRKSALGQHHHHANWDYRGTRNRRGCDGAIVIKDEDHDKNDAAAVDTFQKQHHVKPKKWFLLRKRERKVGLLRCKRMEAQRLKKLQIKRIIEKKQEKEEMFLYEQQVQLQQQDV